MGPSSPEKLEVDARTVQHGVEGLMYLLTECSKLMVCLECPPPLQACPYYMYMHVLYCSTQVNELDFQDSIIVLGFSEELNKELLAVSAMYIQ